MIRLLNRSSITHVRADWMLFGLCVLLGLYVFAQYGLQSAPIKHDMTLQMYAAQLIAEGESPYTTVGLVKPPFTPIYGAVALLIGNLFGAWDVMSVRLAFWLAMALGAGGLYLWASRQFSSRAAGLVSGLTFISFELIGKNAIAGPQPKTLMIVSAIYCLLWLQQARWFGAGVFASLAFLAWQPAAVLMAVVLAASPLRTRESRRGNFVRAALGLTAPIALVIIFLSVHGALLSGIQDTFGANLAYLQNTSEATPLAARLAYNLQHVGNRVIAGCYPEWWLAGIGLLGLLGVTAVYFNAARKDWRMLFSRTHMPIIMYAAVFAGFTLIDFQVCDDMLPFAPVLAFGAAAFFAAAREFFTRDRRMAHLEPRYLLAGFFLVFVLPMQNVFNEPAEKITLQDQVAVAAQVAPLLGPGDGIQQLGDASLLVFLHRRNATKLIFFGPKTGSGILLFIPKGIEGVLEQLRQRPPKLIALSHVQNPDWTVPFFEWLNANYRQQGSYEMFPGGAPTLTVYVRKG